MVILIDAYNVLKYRYGNKVGMRQQEQLIHTLQQYVKRKLHKIYLVFDGGSSRLPIQHSQGSITIIYSGYQETADQVLIELMQQPWAFDGLLVSNDRALRLYATPFNIDCLSVTAFYDIIGNRSAKTAAPTVTSKKYSSTISDPALDALLMADETIIIKDEDPNNSRNSPVQTLGKEQKRYQAKIKRL